MALDSIDAAYSYNISKSKINKLITSSYNNSIK